MDWREVKMRNPLNRTFEENKKIRELLHSGWEFWGGAHQGKYEYTQLFKKYGSPEDYLGRFPREKYANKKSR